MKTIDFDSNTFIAGIMIDHKICDDLIERHKEDDNKECGTVYDEKSGKNVDKNFKASTDLTINPYDDDSRVQNYLKTLNDLIYFYEQKYRYANDLVAYNIIENFNVQHYKKGEGFKQWHFESNGVFPSSRRLFAFMTYLNDVPDGGTKFYHQNITTPAIKGLTIMWPAQWTHVHKGQISYTSEKYIATGWFSYTNLEKFIGKF